MKKLVYFTAIALVFTLLFSCKNEPKADDFDGRIEKMTKQIEEMEPNTCEDVVPVYKDLFHLYFDIIEDIYNTGNQETGVYDRDRIQDIEKLLVAFDEKLSEVEENFFEGCYDELSTFEEEYLYPKLEEIRPYIIEMGLMPEETVGNNGFEDLGNGFYRIGIDTIQDLGDSTFVLHGDTLTEEELMNRLSELMSERNFSANDSTDTDNSEIIYE